MKRSTSGAMALCLGLISAAGPGLAAEFTPQSGQFRPAPAQIRGALGYAGPAPGVAPAVIDGYAALVDPTTGRRYVQRNGGAVDYALTVDTQFRRSDGQTTYVEACSYMCGVGVDDTGTPAVYPNAASITAFGYVVVFHVDRSMTTEPQTQRGHGNYGRLPISAVITYNPDRYSFLGLNAKIRLDDFYTGSHSDVSMSPRPPFEGLPNP